jgi:hypothetical protein
MSFFLMPRHTESDWKFREECAKLRDINGAVTVSRGEEDECDYDELTEWKVFCKMSQRMQRNKKIDG